MTGATGWFRVGADDPIAIASSFLDFPPILIAAGTGNDTVHAGSGNQGVSDSWLNVVAGTGDDVFYGEAGQDSLYGESGTDQLYGGLDADILYGGLDADTLYGDEGDDALDLGDGDDVAYGGSGVDTISGGNGDDLIHVGNGIVGPATASIAAPFVVIATFEQAFGGAGDDTLCGDISDDSLNGDAGSDVIAGGDGADSLYGGTENDRVTGDFGDDILDGGAGDDTLLGGAGDDVLGGEGSDRIIGGGGPDLMTGGVGADVFFFYTEDNLGLRGRSDVITDFDRGEDVLEFGKMIGTFSLVDVFSSDGTGTEFRFNVENQRLICDLDSDGVADFALVLQGITAISMADFGLIGV